jgi:hypothetical protein
VLLLPVLNWPANEVCADEDSLFLQIGKMIGGAIRGEAEPEAFIREMPANEALLKPGEQDRKDFQKRIQAYSDAVEAWVSATCEMTDEQKGRLKEIFAAQVKKDIQAFGKGQDPDQRNKPFPKTFVLLFTRKDGIATEFSEDVFRVLRKDFLSPEQTGKLDAAFTERQTFQRDAYISFLVSMIDKELYLSAEQHDACAPICRGGRHQSRIRCMPSSHRITICHMSLMATLLSSAPGKSILDAPQKKRLADLTGTDPNNQNISFQAEEGVEGWYKKMHQLGSKQRELYLASCSGARRVVSEGTAAFSGASRPPHDCQ